MDKTNAMKRSTGSNESTKGSTGSRAANTVPKKVSKDGSAGSKASSKGAKKPPKAQSDHNFPTTELTSGNQKDQSVVSDQPKENIHDNGLHRRASSLTSFAGRRSINEGNRRKTIEDKKRKTKIFKHLHKLIKHKKLDEDLDGMMKGLRKSQQYEIILPGPRYKRPIDKLLKRVKQERIEDIPPNTNIHKHQYLGESFIGGRGVRKEVELIHSVLQRHRKKAQPKVGWDYNKRQKRLLLGYRHRMLEHRWRFFDPIKNLFPRRIRPNNHWPDAIFFFCNIMIFISEGFHLGLTFAINTIMDPLKDLLDYEHTRDNYTTPGHESYNAWEKVVPLQTYATGQSAISAFQLIIIALGLVGVYLADQNLHLIYFIGMVGNLIMESLTSAYFQKKKYCTDVMKKLTPLLEQMVDNYFEKIPAIDSKGRQLQWNNPQTGKIENIMIRTYKAANLMDRIQKNLLCCGVKGIEDYTSKGFNVPTTCCTPLWDKNRYCSKVIPFDLIEYRAKFLTDPNGKGIGCQEVYATICKNTERLLGDTSQLLCVFRITLLLISCVALILQTRQIRQLKRSPHLRVSAGSISQSLQASAADAGIKSGGGGIQAVVEASKISDKQAEQIHQMRLEAGLHNQDSDEDSSSSSASVEDIPVHTINFQEMKHLQQFVDTEDKRQAEKQDLEKTVEGFAGRFNIFTNKNLQNYVSGIFSTTYQNETNAGLEAINQTLEQQFAQNTTDYNWRKLLHRKDAKDILPKSKKQ